MTYDNSNLYETLFPDYNDDDDDCDDIGRLRINQVFDNIDIKDISRMYDLDSYNKSFPVNDISSFSVVHFNIRNLIINKDELEVVISLMNRKPDVVALTET